MKKYKIVLVNPPTLIEIPKFLNGISYAEWTRVKSGGRNNYKMFPGEHLGLQYIAQYLERHGYDVIIVDGCVNNHRSLDDTLKEIETYYPFDLVGFTGPQAVFTEIQYIAQHLKNSHSEVKIVYGNVFASLNFEEILSRYECYDYICVGEGEYPLLKLVQALESNASIDTVPSIARRINGAVKLNRLCDWQNAMLHNRPSRASINKVIENGFGISMLASRGCPYQCSFCTTASMSQKYYHNRYWRLRDPLDFIDELEELYNKHNVECITIVDDTFAVNNETGRRQAEVIAREIIKRGIKISIMIDTRVDCVERELFELLYDAGLRRVYLGIESVSDACLSLYKKGYSGHAVLNAINVLHEIGIEIVPGIIMFNPEVTIDDLRQTARAINATRHFDPSSYSFELFPFSGVSVTRILSERGLLSGDFPNYKFIYRDASIPILKEYFDKLKYRYLMFMISNGQKNKDIRFTHEYNDFFCEYFLELLNCNAAFPSKESYEHILKTYEMKLLMKLKEIL